MRYLPIAAAIAAAFALVGCDSMKNADTGALTQAGGSAFKAMSLSAVSYTHLTLPTNREV